MNSNRYPIGKLESVLQHQVFKFCRKAIIRKGEFLYRMHRDFTWFHTSEKFLNFRKFRSKLIDQILQPLV